MPAKFSILISTKFKNQDLSKPIDNASEKFGFPISCVVHFLNTLEIIVSNSKRCSVCFFITYTSICMEKNQYKTYILLLKMPLTEQSSGLLGEKQHYRRPNNILT